MRDEKIVLVTKYPEGAEIKTNEAEIFAEKKSATRSEFYAAYAANLNVGFVFDIYPDEYCMADVTVNDKTYSATHIRYEGREYEIVRTFTKNENSMEVTVKK